MTNSPLTIFDEPSLEFAFGQKLQHPRDGLALFGPVDSAGSQPTNIVYGVFGTPEGVTRFRSWSERICRAILTPPSLDPVLWPHFPGFEEVFHALWNPDAAWCETIDPELLTRAASLADAHERVFTVVNHYLELLNAARRRDEVFHLFICVVPDVIYRNCRPLSRVPTPIGRPVRAKERRLRVAMGDMFDDFDPAQYDFSVDFRRQIKARAMELKVPIQIVRESTLQLEDVHRFGTRELSPMSDRAWNLSTTAFYKAGGKPWRLCGARDGVCYVGVAFKRTEEQDTACCAAQMFLDDGDGIVFLGDYGRWYSPEKRQCHLTRDAAHKLLAGVLTTYQEQHGKILREVFLHCRSEIDHEEMTGYREACPSGVKVVGIRVAPERRGLRLYRCGTRPVLRGTFWKIDERRGFLWGSGFKPRLRTYDGSEVPQPLSIDIQHGEEDIETVARDILGLTKLNYNCCKLGEHQPVTIHFSDAVGEILVANRTVQNPSPNFKYYI
jgi:hypothetical protein